MTRKRSLKKQRKHKFSMPPTRSSIQRSNFDKTGYLFVNTDKQINDLILYLGKLVQSYIQLNNINEHMINREKSQMLSQSRPIYSDKDWSLYKTKIDEINMNITTTTNELKELGLTDREINDILIGFSV